MSQPAEIQIPSLGRVPDFKEMDSNRAQVQTAYRQIVHLPTPARTTAWCDFTSPSLSKVLRFERMIHLPGLSGLRFMQKWHT